MANNSFVEFFWISSIVSKRRPFKVDFNLENRKKSAGAKSGEQDGWGTTVVLFFTRKLQFLTDVKTVCFLVLGQHTGHEFCGDALHVEFFCRNCLAWSKADAYIFSNLSDSQTAILENQMTNCIDVNVICWRGRSSTSGIFINLRSSSFETTVPLKTLRSAHTFVSKGFVEAFSTFQ